MLKTPAMLTRSVFLAVIITFLLPVALAVAGNPIPGVGIVVKRPPGSSVAVVVGGEFFGPGSEPFTGGIGLEGQCSHDCGGCDNDCGGHVPDGRIDYAADSPTGPFELTMPPMQLFSVAPIAVRTAGIDSFFDVIITISGQGLLVDEPIAGTLLLPPGQSLDVGTSSQVLDSFFDIHTTMTFIDAATGIAAGSAIESDLRMELQDVGLPIARVADGTLAGHIELGNGGGAAAIPFTYASAGGELVLQLLSLIAETPVSTQPKSWGAVKTGYRQ